MMLPILLLLAQGVLTSSFTPNTARTARNAIRTSHTSLFGTIDEPEHFPLGTMNPSKPIDRDTFLFGDKVSFESIGVGAELITALAASGKHNPTAIQAKTFTAISTGRDVIVGAETGSGKTLSYLLPIIQRLLTESKEEVVDEDIINYRNYPSAIIMVPNKELCSQVYRMTNEIINNMPSGHNVSVGLFTQVLDRWPYSRSQVSPNIAVCTPTFLANFIRGPNILEEDLFRSLRQLVLDEADMLLEGSYLPDVEKVVESFRLIRRDMIRGGEININDRVLQNILVAATLPSYGLRSIEKYIEKRFPLATRINNDHLHKHHPMITQKFVMAVGDVISERRVDMVVRAIKGEDLSVDEVIEEKEEKEEEEEKVEEMEMFIEIEGDDTEYSSVSTARDTYDQTMIFVNTADAAARLAMEIEKKGVRVAEYHKFISDIEKQESLRRFRDEEVSVLVCTDHASRGLDLPNVRHVIQAEFAGNVVQYLHRIGRASRAGVLGRATNIYDTRSADLVKSILSDSEEKKIDQSFSRRRGFRQKLKKEFRKVTGWTPPTSSEQSEQSEEEQSEELIGNSSSQPAAARATVRAVSTSASPSKTSAAPSYDLEDLN